VADFLLKILDFVISFWPIRVIDAGCQGVKYLQGGTVVCLQPGWHWFIPRLQRIEEVSCQTQNTDCGLQSLTTQDGKELTLSLNVTYSISDAALQRASFQHFDSTLVNMARGHAAEIVASESWVSVLEDPSAVASEVHTLLQEEVEPFGIMIEDITLDQLSRVKTLRLLQSTSVY